MEIVSLGNLQCIPCPTANDDDPAARSKENKRQKTGETGTSKNDKQCPKDKEDMAWICAECKEAECGLVGAEDNSGEFLICDGPCKRIFHIPCAGLTSAPSTDDDWLCQDCSRKEHACAYCSEYGEDFVDVFPCQDDQCGLFFHEACLRLHHVNYKYAPTPSGKDNNRRSDDLSSDEDDDEQDEGSRIPVFTCHAHQCWTCTQKDMIQLEKNERALKQQQNSNKKGKASRKKRKKNTSIFQCKPGRLYVSYRKPRYGIVSLPSIEIWIRRIIFKKKNILTEE